MPKYDTFMDKLIELVEKDPDKYGNLLSNPIAQMYLIEIDDTLTAVEKKQKSDQAFGQLVKEYLNL